MLKVSELSLEGVVRASSSTAELSGKKAHRTYQRLRNLIESQLARCSSLSSSELRLVD